MSESDIKFTSTSLGHNSFFEKYSNPFKVIFIPTILIFFGYISFTHVVNRVAWDLLRYMTYALNMFNGHGYTDMDGSLVFFRGPVFPAIIAMSYKLFGVSGLSALGVVKFFSALNPVLIYLLGRNFFSARVGLAAALGLLTSYSISFWSFQFIDPVWPFFILLYLLFLFHGFERESKGFFALAGVSLGVAFLTKEVAILFFPLGVLVFLWVKEYRTKTNLFGIGTYIATTAFLLLPWVFYLYSHDALSFFLGTGGPVVLENMVTSSSGYAGVGVTTGLLTSFVASAKEYLQAFIYFYSGQTNTVTGNFSIAPLFLVAWLYVFYQAVRGDKGCKILLLNLLLFSPLIFFIGKNHWRFGQVLYIMLLSYLALTYSIAGFTGWISRRLNKAAFFAQGGFVVCISVLLAVQVFAHSRNDFGYQNFLKKTTAYHWFSENNVKQDVVGFPDEYLQKIIIKLGREAGGTEPILVDNYFSARLIFFQFEGKRKVFAMPMVWCRNNKVILGNIPKNREEVAIYLHSNNLPFEPQYRIYVLFESQVIDLLVAEHINYVILSPFFNPLHKYFDGSSNYENIMISRFRGEADKAYYLYRVENIYQKSSTVPLLYSDQLVLTLNKILKKDPLKYQFIVDTFLYGVASLTEKNVSSIIDSLYDIPLYHKELGDQYVEDGNTKQAIEEYKIAAQLAPGNIRFHIRLAQLYAGAEQFVLAIAQLDKAKQLDQENPGIRYQLGTLYVKRGQLKQAIFEALAAIELDSENSAYHYLLGQAYQSSGFLDKAKEQFQTAIRLDPENGWYHRFLGQRYEADGQLDSAIKEYQQAVQLDSENVSFHYLLGNLYQRMGLHRKDLEQYQELVRLDPDNLIYQKLLEQSDEQQASQVQ